MIKAASFPEAIAERRYLLPPYPAVYLQTHITNLIADFRDAKDPAHIGAGQALYAEYGPGYASTHAHPVDQWQIYLEGDGKLAKKPVRPVTIQYTDRWVPYGPIDVSDAGFALVALWPRPNDETYEMPKDASRIRESLRGKPHRMLLAEVALAGSPGAASTEESVIEEGPIWARLWRLPPGAPLGTPSPSDGGGQFFVPLSGAVEWSGRSYPARSAIWIGAADPPIRLVAGEKGAEIVGVQFPQQA
jgi:hypothetical protein